MDAVSVPLKSHNTTCHKQGRERDMSVLYHGCSIQNKRSINMDSLLLKERVVDGQSICLAVICDGVGSVHEGAFASSTAIKMMGFWFDGIQSLECLGLQLRNCVLDINESIVQKAQQRKICTASTLSALLVGNGHYYIANVGDSRIYGVNGCQLTQLTQDQTSNGKLTSWIGRPNHIDVFYNEGICGAERFLVCSDGLYKKMEHTYLQRTLAHTGRKNIGKSIDQMVQYVIDQGETDNISAAIVLCES